MYLVLTCQDGNKKKKPFAPSGQVASGRVASGQVASGRVASGRVASGRVASGRVASGRVASGRVAEAGRSPAEQLRPTPSGTGDSHSPVQATLCIFCNICIR